jgi:hypothetical protein
MKSRCIAMIKMSSLFVAAVGLALVGCAVDTTNTSSTDSNDDDDVPVLPSHPACIGTGYHCFAQIVDDVVTPDVSPDAKVAGFGPTDLKAAYALAGTKTGTIAIVDAYNYPNAASDLAAYRSHYGLSACTTASGCLKIVNQSGKTSPLPADAPSDDDWTVEAALDLDMASSACPGCKLILVEANDDEGTGLDVAQNGAASLSPNVISNSWGGPESSSTSSEEKYFNQGSIGEFVAAGDDGYNEGGDGPSYPSTSAYVTAVGGTTLKKSSSAARGWSETAWSDGGSSCSTHIAKPSYETQTACTKRAASDVAAVYNAANGGFIEVGGTSAASPFVAGVYVSYGLGAQGPSYSYSHTANFNDVKSGKNGTCTTTLCKSGTGWDGPTGNGTPNGAKL